MATGTLTLTPKTQVSDIIVKDDNGDIVTWNGASTFNVWSDQPGGYHQFAIFTDYSVRDRSDAVTIATTWLEEN